MKVPLDSPTLPAQNQPKEFNFKPAEGQVEMSPEDTLTKEMMAVPYDLAEDNNQAAVGQIFETDHNLYQEYQDMHNYKNQNRMNQTVDLIEP